MALTVLDVTIAVDVPPDDFFEAFRQIADHDVIQLVTETPGLRWKIWLHNQELQEIGGLYLFEDACYIPEYLATLGPKIESLPFIRNVTIKEFAVAADTTVLTRGPIR